MVLGLGVSGLSVGVWGLGFCGLGVGFILVLAKCDWQNVADPQQTPPVRSQIVYDEFFNSHLRSLAEESPLGILEADSTAFLE